MRPTRFSFASFVVPAVLVCLISTGACKQRTPTPSVYATAIAAAMATPEKTAKGVWPQVTAFYAARHNEPAWHDRKGRSTRATRAIELLRRAEEHGLSRETYNEPALLERVTAASAAKDDERPDPAAIAGLDIQLTAAVLQLGSHVATGRLDPAVIDRRWNARRQMPDLAAALTKAVDDEPLNFLDHVRPVHPEYQALQKALVSLRGQLQSGWPAVPRTIARPDQSHPSVVALRKRLAAGGYLAAAPATESPRFDADVVAAVKRFQEHHALPPSGAIDQPTLEAMNVPLDTRLAQVALNLERWRWLPDNLGDRHFLVNIPQFHLIAREHGAPVMDIRVVVGKPGNETPTFSDEMTQVVFSPYWNIPETIALEETAPAIARDPNYLARNNMEVVSSSGRVVSASEIPWDDEDALRGLSFRQRPGATNALGFVKFLFPNAHNVYIHDTPADALFSRIGRAFSHGCVRVEEPEKLAQYVLRDRPEWTPEAIFTAMRAGEEQHVKLNAPIPVHIVYVTAWVDASGGMHFLRDVYGYDAVQARARSASRASD
jgi:murein L,D-transpeptidase YcbB/YkuD